MRRATTTGGELGSGASTGRVQASGSSVSRRALGRPELDEAGRVRPRALVHGADGVVLEGEAAEMRGDREGRVDRREHRRGRAERSVEPHVLEAQLGAPALAAASSAGSCSNSRGSAPWKPIDRLLRVADREEGATAPRARAAPGGEILGERRRISHCSGLVSCASSTQDVVDAAVELVEHPGRVAAREQRQGLGDEIVEIERAEPRLLRLDLRRDRARER